MVAFVTRSELSLSIVLLCCRPANKTNTGFFYSRKKEFLLSFIVKVIRFVGKKRHSALNSAAPAGLLSTDASFVRRTIPIFKLGGQSSPKL